MTLSTVAASRSIPCLLLRCFNIFTPPFSAASRSRQHHRSITLPVTQTSTRVPSLSFSTSTAPPPPAAVSPLQPSSMPLTAAAAASVPQSASSSSPPLSRDSILLHGLMFHGHHGYYAAEQELGQKFRVDLRLSCDLSQAAQDGELHHTVDYGHVYDDVKRVVEGTKHRLLEQLCMEIISAVLGAHHRVAAVSVAVKKPQVAVSGVVDFLGVEMSRTRGEWEEELRRIKKRIGKRKDITQLGIE